MFKRPAFARSRPYIFISIILFLSNLFVAPFLRRSTARYLPSFASASPFFRDRRPPPVCDNPNAVDDSTLYIQDEPRRSGYIRKRAFQSAIIRSSNNSSIGNKTTMGISYELLKKQNADTSNAIIEHWANSETFANLSKYEGDLTVKRDQEDADKLQVGIDYAKEKGVIDPKYVPEPYVNLDVLGKTPDQVAEEIINHVNRTNEKLGETDPATGSVIVLCGLSGTGKGTTVTKLRTKLEEAGKEVVTWSNGNIFRSVTLLAATWCEQQGLDGFDKEKALTPENLASFMTMLSFGKNEEGLYDTHIKGLGLDMYISKVQNTELKQSKVSKNIPTVAEVTQGEVILFAAKAVETLREAGKMVLLEGREQTVNFVKTPHRFILMLSDESLIGKRRAAQRVMAGALHQLEGQDHPSDGAVDEALEKTLASIMSEAN